MAAGTPHYMRPRINTYRNLPRTLLCSKHMTYAHKHTHRLSANDVACRSQVRLCTCAPMSARLQTSGWVSPSCSACVHQLACLQTPEPIVFSDSRCMCAAEGMLTVSPTVGCIYAIFYDPVSPMCSRIVDMVGATYVYAT